MKQVCLNGISFEKMTKVAKLFEYGSPYWEWCVFRYNGTNICGDIIIEFSAGSRQGHQKDVPKLISEIAEALK